MGNYKWKYDVEYVGYKAHGNSIMASLGLVQLKYLDRDNAYRRQIAKWYLDRLSKYSNSIRFVKIEEGCESSFHLFQILVERRDELIIFLNSAEIYPGVHYADNTNYRMYSYAKGTCPYAEYVSEHTVTLPMNLYLTYEDVQYICNKVIEFVEKN